MSTVKFLLTMCTIKYFLLFSSLFFSQPHNLPFFFFYYLYTSTRLPPTVLFCMYNKKVNFHYEIPSLFFLTDAGATICANDEKFEGCKDATCDMKLSSVFYLDDQLHFDTSTQVCVVCIINSLCEYINVGTGHTY